MLLLMVSVAAFTATFSGGIFALKVQNRRHLVMGFSAGAVISVAFFELVPEALALGSSMASVRSLLAGTALGFFSYMVLDRIEWLRAHLGAGAGWFSAHSFLDGAAIGLAFQVSRPVGVVLTVAVLIHDFADGVNTATVVLRDSGDRRRALRWLFADAVAPGLGIAVTGLISVPAGALGGLLALFSGFFLYIGASELIPASFKVHPKLTTTLMTLFGAVVMYVAITLAGR